MGYANGMRNISIKIVLMIAVLVGGDNAVGTSDLPDCPTEGIKDNCVGTWTDSNGVTYIGELKSGVPNGRGTSNVMGDTYVGEWKGGHWNGQGTFTSADGGKYVGDFKIGKFNGQGTFTDPDGDNYVGKFKDDQFNGQGTYTYADGGKYVGQWKDGKRDGQGTYTSTDRAIREGIWQDGKFLGTVAEVERAERARQGKEDKYERIYNACLLDKGSDIERSVSGLERDLKTTCASIAEDPSFLEGLRYN